MIAVKWVEKNSHRWGIATCRELDFIPSDDDVEHGTLWLHNEQERMAIKDIKNARVVDYWVIGGLRHE